MKWSLRAAAALSLLLHAGLAHAYCRTRSCEASGELDCGQDEQGCSTLGLPLYWPGGCVPLSVQEDGAPSQGIDAAETELVLQQAMHAWTSADCGGGPPSIELETTGPVACDRHEYNQSAGNANVVVYREDSWPYQDRGDVLALTSVTFNTETGEIYDADIEINTVEATFSAGAPSPAAFDLRSVLTHELGHFLGLSHTRLEASTMFPSFDAGQTNRASLADDDVAGVCAIYPPGREPATTVCEPRHGFSSTCEATEPAPIETPVKSEDNAATASPDKHEPGCSFTPSRRAPLAALAICLALAGLRRRNTRASQRECRRCDSVPGRGVSGRDGAHRRMA